MIIQKVKIRYWSSLEYETIYFDKDDYKSGNKVPFIWQPDAGKLAVNSDKHLQYDRGFVIKRLQDMGVSPKSLKDELRQLEEWYAKQPHLPDDPLIKLRLFQYFFVFGLSAEKIKKKVDNYYSLINKFADFLMNRDPFNPSIENELRNINCTILSKMTDQHHRVIMFRLKEPRVFDPAESLKSVFMLADYRVYNEITDGEHWIFDCQHVSLKNVMDTMAITVKALLMFTNCYGLKVKGIHICNVPSYAVPLINLFKKIAKQKISDRFCMYDNFEDIFDVFPKSMFPRDIGGDEPSFDEIRDGWIETLQSPQWREWFISRDNLCADESKRIGPSHFEEPNMYGVDGSFKTLAID